MKLFKSYSIYFIGVIVNRVASVILLPIYTTYLHPEDYGVLEILTMMLVFASIIFGERVGQAFFREWGDAKSDRQRGLAFGTALSVSTAFTGVGYLIIVLLSGYLSKLQFGSEDYVWIIQIYSINLVLNILKDSGLNALRAMEKPWAYLSFTLFYLGMQISFNLLALMRFDLGVEGVVYASVLSTLIIAVLVNVYVLSNVSFGFESKLAKSMVSFSYPLVVAGVFMFVVVYADRYFLRTYHGLGAVGVYALGYKFGFILLSIVWQPFMSAWDVEKYKIHRDSSLHEYYAPIFEVMVLVLMLCGAGMVLWVDDFLYFVAKEPFWPAYEVVPIIVLAYVIFAATGFLNFGLLLERKTGYFGRIAFYSAIVSLILYAFLIPEYGMKGAAWATMAVFLYRTTYLFVKGKAYFDMNLRMGRILVSLLAYMLLVGFYLNNRESSPDIMNSIILSLAAALYFALSVYHPAKKVIEYAQK